MMGVHASQGDGGNETLQQRIHATEHPMEAVPDGAATNPNQPVPPEDNYNYPEYWKMQEAPAKVWCFH